MGYRKSQRMKELVAKIRTKGTTYYRDDAPIHAIWLPNKRYYSITLPFFVFGIPFQPFFCRAVHGEPREYFLITMGFLKSARLFDAYFLSNPFV